MYDFFITTPVQQRWKKCILFEILENSQQQIIQKSVSLKEEALIHADLFLSGTELSYFVLENTFNTFI